MEKICGIYKIISPSKRIYIGQSVNILRRWNIYKLLLCEEQTRLYRSLKKYGWGKHKFEIIHECSQEALNELEKYYVDLFQTFNSENGLNLREGGNSGRKASEETKIRMSNSMKGVNTWMKGRKFSEETKEKMRKRMLGKKTSLGYRHTQEIKDKLRKINTGKKMSMAMREKMSILMMGNKRNLGKKLSKETKMKIGNANRKNK